MSIRAKISFMAFHQGKTICELIISQIVKTHTLMCKQKIVFENPKTLKIRSKVLDNIGNTDISIMKFLMAENLKKVIDEYIMKSEPGEKIPDKMFELFELANHVTNYEQK
tara:strand:- start:489 stop:818 length:330 start_codon:yes stop_codon:yes gene_type:complete